MNERILELYQQAHMVREYPLDDPMRGGNPPTVYWGGELSAERFAELIVNQCIKAVEDTPLGYGDYRDQILQSMRNSCVESIKYEFGVEE
jgi:hypothetical protein